jgi:polar amino acid transport system permease protein
MHFADILFNLWRGVGTTAEVIGLSLLYAVPFAGIGGALQCELTGWKRFLVTAFIEFWRSSPIVVLLFVFYYSLPAFNIHLSAMTVSALVIGMNIGGYGSQALRAGLQAIDRGQREAGMALGLSLPVNLVYVLLPQAFRAGLPNYVNLLIQLIKGTALVSLLSLADMTYRAKDIAQVTFDPAPPYTALLLSYFVICYPLTIVGCYFERRLGPGAAERHV